MELRKRGRAGENNETASAVLDKRPNQSRRPIKNIVLSLSDSDFGGVEWYCSHVDPDVILWSSEPNIVVPTVELKLPIPVHATPEKGNMFIVKAPPAPTSNPSRWEEALNNAASRLCSSNALLIIAGAGIGVDSGLPDYRGPDGFWRAYPALAEKGISLEHMSSTQWFKEDPCFAWGYLFASFYAHRYQLYADATPHAGFSHLLTMAQRVFANNFYVLTSNIDSQFQKAGFPVDRIYECHGSLAHLQCVRDCCNNVKRDSNPCKRTLTSTNRVWPLEAAAVPKVDANLRCTDESTLPRCPCCGDLSRPNVSMFGDTNSNFNSTRTHKQQAALMRWMRTLHQHGKRIAVLEMGCGVSIHSLRIEAEALIQLHPNITLIRINPSDFTVPEGQIGIGLGSRVALEQLAERVALARPVRPPVPSPAAT